MAVSSLYYYELYWHVVTMAILWPLFISQLLVFRFSLRRRVLPTKRHLIWIGIVSMVLQSIRTVDPSSAFGRLSLPVQRSLYSQLGAILFYAVVVVVVATAKTLCVQLGRPLPNWFSPTMWGINVASHISTFPCLIANAIYFHRGDNTRIKQVYAAATIIFAVASVLTLVCYWVLFLSLRKKIREFLTTLLQHEEAMRLKRAGTATPQTQTQMLTQTQTRAMLLPAQLRSDDASGDVGASPSPEDSGRRIDFSNATPGCDTPNEATSPCAQDSPKESPKALPSPSPYGTPKRTPLQANAAMTSDANATSPILSVRVMAITVPPSPVVRVVSPPRRTAAVAPAPIPPSPKLPFASFHTPAESVQVSPPLTITTATAAKQSSLRLQLLQNAIRRMNILAVLLTLLLVGTVLSGFQNYQAIADGGVQNAIVLSPYQMRNQNESYRMGGAVQAIVNQIGLGVLLW